MKALCFFPFLFPVLLSGACDKASSDSGADSGTPDRVERILALDGDVTSGESVYASSCAGCHGASGTEGFAPNLAEKVPDVQDAALIGVILDGKGDMPAQDLAEQAVADLLAYLRAQFS
jgi:cytochrome c551